MVLRLPKGWVYRELGDLVRIESGGTPSRSNADYWGGATPWITAKDLKTFDLVDSQERLSDGGAARAVVAPKDTVLVLVRGMGLFKDVPIGVTIRPMAFNQDVKALHPNDDISARFLGYALQAQRHYLMGKVDMAGHGTGRLPTEVLESLPLPIPSRWEQRRIVAVLDACDAEISVSMQHSAHTSQFHQAMVRGLVARVSAPMVMLRDVVSRIARAPENADATPLTISAALGLIPQTRFFGKRVASRSVGTYTLLRRGEFAYNKSYSDGYPLGATKRLEVLDAGILSSLYLCFGISDEARLDGDYLAIAFDSGWFNKQLQQIAQEGARNHGLLNVSANDFFDMQLPLPSPNAQREIVGAVKLAATQKELAERRLNAVKRRKRGLMQKLLTGQWRLASGTTGDLSDREMAHA